MGDLLFCDFGDLPSGNEDFEKTETVHRTRAWLRAKTLMKIQSNTSYGVIL